MSITPPDRPWRIVCMGGGTGLPQLLSGFKLLARQPSPLPHRVPGTISLQHLTALVTAFDDGGSSGRIVETYRTLPPGDLRNCLVALADERVEPLLTHFFNHRFREDEDDALAGHSAGNLLLLTLSQVYGGDLRKALLAIRRILPIESTLLFPTLSPALLCAELADGTIIRGESHIAARDVRYPISQIFLEHRAVEHRALEPQGLEHPETTAEQGFPPMEGVLEAIAQADLITLGPGSLYTSILPHFLVDGISEAIQASKARKVYVCNLMTETGETDGFRVSDHVRTLERQARIQVDAVVANDALVPTPMRRVYERERLEAEFKKSVRALERAFEQGLEEPSTAHRLRFEAERAREDLTRLSIQLSQPGGTFVQVLPQAGEQIPAHIRLITADLLANAEVSHRGSGTKKVIRHDPLKLASTVLRALQEELP